jgi:hypothetical protein
MAKWKALCGAKRKSQDRVLFSSQQDEDDGQNVTIVHRHVWSDDEALQADAAPHRLRSNDNKSSS